MVEFSVAVMSIVAPLPATTNVPTELLPWVLNCRFTAAVTDKLATLANPVVVTLMVMVVWNVIVPTDPAISNLLAPSTAVLNSIEATSAPSSTI